MNILGVSAFFHDSAACLVQDGRIVAAAQEERFTRIKNDAQFPSNAMEYCLREGSVGKGEIDLVVFHEKPLTHYLRILETQIGVAPRSWSAFKLAMPAWTGTKLWVPFWIERACRKLGYGNPKRIGYSSHHLSHAASAFFPSPYMNAAILTMDGVGEWATTSIAHGKGGTVNILSEIQFPHSLGLLYSAFTYTTGFKVNSGEYKMMGLAPYGRPIYAERIKEHLIDLKPDGSFALNMKYFNYLGGLTMTSPAFHQIFGDARLPESDITEHDVDLAASIQAVLEEAVCNLGREAVRRTGCRNLCLAGGVALNCVANTALLRSGVADEVWVQPAAGDAGGALGAALYAWHHVLGRDRECTGQDSMQGAQLGPKFSPDEVRQCLDGNDVPYQEFQAEELPELIAALLANGNVVGLFQGRMEFGPRALGNRSILGDPRSPEMQSVMNLKIKFRESFRPFAPAVLREHVSKYFDTDADSPYMTFVANVRPERRMQRSKHRDSLDLVERVNAVRSDVPAITHVDYTARIQTVDESRSPLLYQIIKAFENLTGCAMVINTSFNVRGEPVVATPEDAYRCFMATDMDYLVLENILVSKADQPEQRECKIWKTEFELD